MSSSYRRFIIVGDARTGSNMVAHALNSHPQIICFREVFNWMQDTIDYHVEGYDGGNAEELDLRNRRPVEFLHRRIFTEQPPEIRAVGFKFMYGHMYGEQYAPLLELFERESDIAIVHMKRRNLLRSLVSLRIAERTNEWIHPGVERPRMFAGTRDRIRSALRLRPRLADLERKRTTLTVEECNAYFARSAEEMERFTKMFASHASHDVWYEDLLHHRAKTLAGVVSFLGVEPQPLEVSTGRQNPESLRDLIANYDELRKAFRGTPIEAYFE